MAAAAPLSALPALPALHERRLRDIWRSAGWPCRDNIELDLLAAGLLSRHSDTRGFETLRLTDAGIQQLAAKRRRHQTALSAHEALVQRVALQQQRAGRVVWCGLSLRAPLPAPTLPADEPHQAGAAPWLPLLEGDGLASPQPPLPLPPPPLVHWAMAMPDVYAIRHTTVEAYVEPAAFEIKVSRADLLGDLRRPAKAAAYRALASQCWYVLKRGIAELEEIPAAFGVMWADDAGLEAARPAPARPYKLPFAVWMALARATALPPLAEDGQAML